MRQLGEATLAAPAPPTAPARAAATGAKAKSATPCKGAAGVKVAPAVGSCGASQAATMDGLAYRPQGTQQAAPRPGAGRQVSSGHEATLAMTRQWQVEATGRVQTLRSVQTPWERPAPFAGGVIPGCHRRQRSLGTPGLEASAAGPRQGEAGACGAGAYGAGAGQAGSAAWGGGGAWASTSHGFAGAPPSAAAAPNAAAGPCAARPATATCARPPPPPPASWRVPEVAARADDGGAFDGLYDSLYGMGGALTAAPTPPPPLTAAPLPAQCAQWAEPRAAAAAPTAAPTPPPPLTAALTPPPPLTHAATPPPSAAPPPGRSFALPGCSTGEPARSLFDGVYSSALGF